MPAPLPPTPSERIQRLPDGNENKRTRGRYLSWALFFAVIVLLTYLTYMTVVRTEYLILAADRSQAQSACQQTLDSQVTAWNSGNLEGFMAGYWNNEELTFCSGSTVTKGWQATTDRYRKRYQADGKEMGKLQFDEVQIEVLSSEAVMVRGRWKLTLSDGNPEGLFTLIIRQFADGWKIVYDHTSVAEPAKKS